MNNPACHFNPGSNQYRDAVSAINQLRYADLWRSAGTISNTTLVRIDVQGTLRDGSKNLQAQLNGVNGNSTVAAVLIPANLGQTRNVHQQKEVLNKVKSAFKSSLFQFVRRTPHIWEVYGNFSN